MELQSKSIDMDNTITDAQKKVILDAKDKVTEVIQFIKKLEKINKSNKKSRKAIKTMQKFLNCHITSTAIYKRYQEVMILLEEYAAIGAKEGNEA